MLVLSRKPSEAIIIGSAGKIRVTILAVNGYQVKVGIEASRDITVHREEVYLRINQEAVAQEVIKQTTEQAVANDGAMDDSATS